MTDIIQQIEELQEECGHEWHLFIGGPETPEEWRGKCSYRRGDGTWSDELAGGMTAGRFYRIRRIVAVPPPCTHRLATEEDMNHPMPKDTLYQDVETGEWLRPAFHDWRRSDKTPYAVPKDWKPERTEPEAPKSVALPIDWSGFYPVVSVNRGGQTNSLGAAIGLAHWQDGHEYRLCGYGEDPEPMGAGFAVPYDFLMGKRMYAVFHRVETANGG